MIRRFVCERHQDIPYGLWPADASLLAEDARRIAEEKQLAYIRLPLYPLAESRILGADILDSPEGARMGQPLAHLPEPVLAGNDARLILQAVTEAAASGKKVMMDINGPVAVLETLAGTAAAYRFLRRDEPYLQQLCQALLDWACSCLKAGASIISLADPLATEDLIGKANFCRHYAPLLIHMLQGIINKYPDCVIHICGKLSQDMLDNSLAVAEELPLRPPVSLDKALAGQKGIISGLACVNNTAKDLDCLYNLILRC